MTANKARKTVPKSFIDFVAGLPIIGVVQFCGRRPDLHRDSMHEEATRVVKGVEGGWHNTHRGWFSTAVYGEPVEPAGR